VKFGTNAKIKFKKSFILYDSPFFFVLGGDENWEFFDFFFPPDSRQILLHLTLTSVACVIGPSVNTFEVSTKFFLFHTPIFAICLNFQQQQNPLENQNIFHTLALKL